MAHKQKARAVDPGASEVRLAASLNTSDNIIAGLRLQRQAAAIHRCGPRALGELLQEVVATCPELTQRIAAYAAINPAAVALLDAARFVTPLASMDGGRAL